MDLAVPSNWGFDRSQYHFTADPMERMIVSILVIRRQPVLPSENDS